MTEKASALYEQGANCKGNKKRKDPKKRRYRSPAKRDTSEYYVNEPKPNDAEWFSKLNCIIQKCRHNPKLFAPMRRYIKKWFSWIHLGLCECKDFLVKSCLSFLPELMNLNSI